jgi:hypothetical protein
MIEPEELRRWERQIATMLRHAGADDPEGFAAVALLLDRAATEGLRLAAQHLRQSDGNGQPGYSWAEIARALDVPKSSAVSRYGRPDTHHHLRRCTRHQEES